MTWLDDVKEFHEACGQPNAETPTLRMMYGSKLRLLRRRLMAEEYDEYIEAERENDLVGIAKELVDIGYILCGTAASYGIPLDEVWRAIHESNMAKRGPDGKFIVREDGKILKPPGWKPADVAGILRRAGGSL